MAEGPHRLAVLIDADNVNAGLSPGLIAAVDRLGTATVRRAYGNPSGLANWAEALSGWGALAAPTLPGKNAADIALVIDAMDLLHAGTVDGFCLVSSDRDIARLVIRLREAGKPVHVFGEAKGEAPLAALTTFHVLAPKPAKPKPKPPAAAKPPAAKAAPDAGHVQRWIDSETRKLIALRKDGDGWVSLTQIGKELRALPSFGRHAWPGKLSTHLKAIAAFEVSTDGGGRVRVRR